jgi:pyruvate formate lyase activating enzyme
VDVAAFVPLSLSDHEGHVAAVVFVPGCNFRCPFCHNPDLVLPERAAGRLRVPVDEVLDELRDRRDFLDSVVVSGGEPTLQPDLQEFLAAVRAMGLGVKLDTNGSRPDVLRDLFERKLVDYVAMDIKAPSARYSEFAGVPVDLVRIEESIRLIRSSAPDYEFRTTVAPGLAAEDLRTIADWILGAKRYVLQPFRVPPEKGLLDPTWSDREALPPHALRGIWDSVAPLVGGGGVRAPT